MASREQDPSHTVKAVEPGNADGMYKSGPSTPDYGPYPTESDQGYVLKDDRSLSDSKTIKANAKSQYMANRRRSR